MPFQRNKCIGLFELERRKQGINAQDLAKRIGAGRSTVSNVERGLQLPTDEFKRKAAKALGVRITSIFPEWYVLARKGSTGLERRHGHTVAFTSRARAERSARPGVNVVGPLGPDYFAAVLGLAEVDVPASLLIDPDEPESGPEGVQ